MTSKKLFLIHFSAIIVLIGFSASVHAEKVDWQGPAGSKIKDIRYFPKQTQPSESSPAPIEAAAIESTPGVVSNVINSPPVNGFVPWIVITPTNESIDAETTGIFDAFASSYVNNPPFGHDKRTDYMIGLFDTGASTHVIGYQNAVQAGLYNSTYLTEDNYVEVSGVTGSVEAHVTWPYALFVTGLDALEPNAPGETEMVLPTTTGMLGEYNVATLIGQNPGAGPDLATAIGTPMSVFYDTRLDVEHPVTATHNGTDYTAPRITFYEKDTSAPGYDNYIPLELKPLGSISVQYITYGFDLEDFLANFPNIELDYSPLTPSIIIGTSSQSLFFIHGLDLTEGSQTAQDKNRFMLDTGAQVTVIGTRIAARLKLNPDNKDFEVEIEGVTGDSIMAPGFFVDSLNIPAMGQWLEFTNVPVVLLDISSPEGGKLDGIIGMNLFTEYNLMLRGGGFMLQDDPRLEFERIQSILADIAPEPRDGKVNMIDFSAMSAAWQTNNTTADIAPAGNPDGIVDLQDLIMLADYWLTDINP
ncbi:MAG: aspartyl protease family protein [Phycisphaerae bacterium]|nr:aspartyl protease family protein [Phycisphaerae bacterium]